MAISRTTIPALLALCLWAAAPALGADAASAKIEVKTGKDATGQPYWLYLPKKLDPKKTYWLVVGVHGLGGDGQGACGIADWAAKHDCIVVGPSMTGAYPFLENGSVAQFTGLVADLKKQYALHDRVFVFGFSAGAQFSHRLLLNHPDLLAGCAAHAAGSWDFGPGPGIGGLLPGPAKAVEKSAVLKDIPFVVSCGVADERLAMSQRFAAEAKAAGLCVETAWVPKLGHGLSRQNLLLAEWCFVVASQLRPALDAHAKSIEAALAAGKADEAAVLAKKKPVDSSKWRGDMAQRCLEAHAAKVKALMDKPKAPAPAKPVP